MQALKWGAKWGFKTMKLNGWKRIGIVASVVWVLGAGIRTLTDVQNTDIATASALTLSCEEANNGRWSVECDKRSTDYLAEVSRDEWIETATVAFVPVPVGWGFAYLVFFLVRWVRCGFA